MDEIGGGDLSFSQQRGLLAGSLVVFRVRLKLNDLFCRSQGLAAFALLLETIKRGLIGFERLSLIFFLDQLGLMERL